MKYVKLILTCIFIFFIASCEFGSDTKSNNNKELENLEFEIECDDTVLIGEIVELHVICGIDAEFVFNASNDNISFTSENNVMIITGVKEGKTMLSATVKGTNNSKTFEIYIMEAVITPLRISYTGKNSFYLEEEAELKATVLPLGAEQDVEYKLSNDNFKIENGKLVALSIGTCVLTIKCANFDVSLDVNLSVYDKDVNNTIPLQSGVTREMTSPNFWLSKISYANDVILTTDEIQNVNKSIFNASNTKVVNILDYSKTLTKATVQSMIESYTVSTSWKINGSAQTSSYASTINAKCNINAIPSTVNVEYGLVNSFSRVRSFPTNDVATTTNSFDRLQETSLEVGEGVIILHYSSDNEWYFVQSYNYYGWVEASTITKVEKDEFSAYLNANEFIIVNCEELVINGIKYRMSTKLLIENETNSHYVCKVPTKEGFSTIDVPIDADVSKGYVPYTTGNVLKLAFKLLDNPYSWGDTSIDGHDCSSTMNAVYKCFGFIMPRNTSNQNKIPLNIIDVSGLSTTQKANKLLSVRPGTLVFMSGHVMMYIGTNNGTQYILHNYATYMGCNITTTSNYVNSFNVIVEMVK